jgi:hypothetical protein
MNEFDTSLPELSQLIERRLAVVRCLAESLESSTLSLAHNDAEAIARGAAHQAELCRQWNRLESQLRQDPAGRWATALPAPSGLSAETAHSARLQAEWEALQVRIRYVTRVHWSLLRHLQRSLAVLNRVVDSCAPTYTPVPNRLGTDVRPRAGE